MKIVATVFGAVILVTGLCWFGMENEFLQQTVFSPKWEGVRGVILFFIVTYVSLTVDNEMNKCLDLSQF